MKKLVNGFVSIFSKVEMPTDCIKCPECNGSGLEDVFINCEECDGLGYVKQRG
ncbi:hypothetical protein [Virgibacillus salexigens]|uniref:Uncharacterized protein n=1 Tax=Virgibacillus massiliensis TaxID=1462526 RepID=A0A024QBD4_9BACI|nr:hypothetical protein [Virgibacillus massiliensis]CDQ39562.1 hypothetical protein BN990_01867 [Virgibacillus massiliensis]